MVTLFSGRLEIMQQQGGEIFHGFPEIIADYRFFTKKSRLDIGGMVAILEIYIK